MTTPVKRIKLSPPLVNKLMAQLPKAPQLPTILNQFVLDTSIQATPTATVTQNTGTTVRILSQSAEINPTSIISITSSGLYLISVQLRVSVPSSAGLLNVPLTWRDEIGQLTQVIAPNLDLSGLNEQHGTATVEVVGGSSISFAAYLSGVTGVPSFNIFIYILKAI